MATEVVEVATESEEDVVINCVAIFYEEGKERTCGFVSVFGEKSDAVSGFLAYFYAVLRFSDPLTPLPRNRPVGITGE